MTDYTTAETITDEQIRALRAEAAAAGDHAQVRICEAALDATFRLVQQEARALLSTALLSTDKRGFLPMPVDTSTLTATNLRTTARELVTLFQGEDAWHALSPTARRFLLLAQHVEEGGFLCVEDPQGGS